MNRIVLYIPTLGYGGAERVFINLANELCKKYELILLTHNSSNSIYGVSSEVKIICIGGKSNIGTLLNLFKFIYTYKPHVLISTLNIPNIFAAIVKKLSFQKFKFIPRQAAPVNISKRKFIMTQLLRFSFLSADCVIVNSYATKQSIIETLNLSRSDKIRVIYNPVFSAECLFLAEEFSNYKELNLKKLRYILSVGRLESTKNFTFLINAFYLSKSKKNFKLIILGEGSQRVVLENLVKELDLQKNVLFPGSISNPFPFYKNASLFVSTSKWEGFGNVIVEALGFGLPVIINASSGAPTEIIDDGLFGYQVQQQDPLDLASKIDAVIKKSSFDAKLLQKRAEEFSIDKITKEYEDTFF